MASRHVDLTTIDGLREEQVNIDRLIDSLLKDNPVSSVSVSSKNRNSENNVPLASPVTTNRGRGRPPRVNTRNNPASPLPGLPDKNASLEVVIECLNKLNNQNKRLLDFVGNLAGGLNSDHSDRSSPQVTPVEESVITGVNDRLEKIEQNLNSTTLICRGPSVEELLKQASQRGLADPQRESALQNSENLEHTAPPQNSTILEQLKGDICRAVCGDEVTGVDIKNLQLSFYGREKKCLRLNCFNHASKLYLLKRIRERKPQGFYLNEFLTTKKREIFYNLRQLKKQHPNVIKSVFTRDGNVYYVKHNSKKFWQVSSLDDLKVIQVNDPNDPSGGAVPKESGAV